MPIPIEFIDRLRSWFFPHDRDITMQSGRTITLGDGRVVDDELNGIVPVGGVIFWPSGAGSIPTNWTTFSAAAGRFLVGAGGSFSNGSTGGAETINLQHSHTGGTLATDSVGHTHGPGTLATNSNLHGHTSSFAVGNDSHTHTYSPTVGAPSTTLVGSGAFAVAADNHTHSLSGSLNQDSHNHTLSGATANASHSHTASSGVTASTSHSHSVTSGSTATALSSAQSTLPPYLAGTWIQRSS